MNPLRCLIVDDEPMARKGMMEYVREVPFLSAAGECGSASEAAGVLASQSIDLLLLDIQMPRMSGLEFLRTLRQPPLVIITTAFSEFAIEGYELEVVDYLLKPIPFDRFLKATRKAYDYFQLSRNDSQRKENFFFVKCNSKLEKVMFEDILFVEAMQNYIIIHTRLQKLVVYMTLSGVEERLPAELFLKVHKSFIVAVSHVMGVEENFLVIGKERIPVSRALRDSVMQRILGNNLLSR